MEIIIIAGTAIVLAFLSYGFYEWLDKVELERKYLQGLLKEQEKDSNILRKNV